jgi:hypothetical protein
MTAMASLLLIGIITGTSGGAAQDLLSLLRRSDSDFDWSRWEAPRPQSPPVVRPVRMCTGSPEAQRARDEDLAGFYHELDFDGDGWIDIIYSGPHVGRTDCVFTEGGLTVFFRKVRGGFSEAFVDYGILVAASRSAPWHPMTFVLREDGCCGDFYVRWRFFRAAAGSPMQQFDDLIGTHMTLNSLPTTFFPQPRPFTVTQNEYRLRARPVVDDTSETLLPLVEQRGNALATYKAGATGLAFAETSDRSGRVWWLVVMNPGNLLGIAGERPDAVTRQQGSRRLGWMSARFLGQPAPP